MPRSEEWKYVCFTCFGPFKPVQSDKVSYLVYQREKAASGREHWQGYAETKGRGLSIKQWQSELKCENAHIEQRKGTSEEAANYCKKSETREHGPYEFGSISVDLRKRKAEENDELFTMARAESNTSAEYLKYIADRAPALFNKSFTSINGAAKFFYPTIEKAYSPPASVSMAWKLSSDLLNWIENESKKKERAKCLILVGATRLGKTSWARSLGKHMYWRGMTNFGRWNDEAKFLIFDDIEWKYIPQKKSLLTQMGDATLTDKYVKKIDVQVKQVAIVLTNFWNGFDSESDYWEKNTTIVYVTEKMFSEEQRAIA
ncbi:replication-associated protein [Blackfly DNA Virus 13]|nr:replication-associated protein [Blackfly DNA Virus 13]